MSLVSPVFLTTCNLSSCLTECLSLDYGGQTGSEGQAEDHQANGQTAADGWQENPEETPPAG